MYIQAIIILFTLFLKEFDGIQLLAIRNKRVLMISLHIENSLFNLWLNDIQFSLIICF